MNLASNLIRYRMSDGETSEKYVAILQQLLEGLSLDEDDNNEVQDMEKSIEKYQETHMNYYEPFMKKRIYA